MASLTHYPNADVFVWAGSYEERLLPKEAGFRWHPEKKAWWTNDRAAAARLLKYADPAAAKALQAHEAVQAASRAVSTAFVAPVPKGLTLYPFQNAGVEYMLQAYDAGRPGALLAHEMGLGKTPQSLALVNALRERLGRQPRVLYIAPKSLLLNVRREASKWLLGDPRVQIWTTKTGSTDADLVIINYDILVKRHADLTARGSWDLVILDESQAIKNQKAKRTKAALSIPAKFRVFATGTPIMNRPIELFTTLSCLDPQGLGRNYVNFGVKYCGAYEDRWGWHFDGATNLEELQERLRSGLMTRVLKKDVLTELPAKVRQIVALEPEGRAAKAAIKAQKAAWDQIVADLGYEEAVRQMATTGGVGFEEMAALRAELATAKVEPVLDHLRQELESVESIVVFAHHHGLLDALAEGLAEYGVVRIDGRTPHAARQDAVDAFQAGKARVFIGGISAAGVGLTLTRASNVYLAELPWTPASVQQAEDRCHRIGQRDTVMVQHLVFDGSLDADMATTIINKQATADSALDTDHTIAKQEEMARVEKTVAQEIEKLEAKRALAPVMAAKREDIHLALRILAGMCDGAREKDDAGYNGVDSPFGKSLASQDTLSLGQAIAAFKMLAKYRRQLPADLYERLYGGKSAAA